MSREFEYIVHTTVKVNSIPVGLTLGDMDVLAQNFRKEMLELMWYHSVLR